MNSNGSHINSIVKLAESHFQNEIDEFFKPEPITYSRNISHAIINQFYLPHTELVSVATNNDNLLAYTWLNLEVAPWSDDKIAYVKMAHVDLTLPIRLRIQLVTDMFTIWENFAKLANVSIICSTTMRKDQSAFLKLHEKHGYDIRGSYAYKKLSA